MTKISVGVWVWVRRREGGKKIASAAESGLFPGTESAEVQDSECWSPLTCAWMYCLPGAPGISAKSWKDPNCSSINLSYKMQFLSFVSPIPWNLLLCCDCHKQTFSSQRQCLFAPVMLRSSQRFIILVLVTAALNLLVTEELVSLVSISWTSLMIFLKEIQHLLPSLCLVQKLILVHGFVFLSLFSHRPRNCYPKPSHRITLNSIYEC